MAVARRMTTRKPDRIFAFTLGALRIAILAGALVVVASVAALAWLWPNLWRYWHEARHL
jgi:hypothetical protein